MTCCRQNEHHQSLRRALPGTASIICATAVVFALVLVALGSAPLADAISFSGDEGPELMKALLVNRGYRLYAPVWSDQPPLYTAILSTLFRYCGTTPLWPRALSVLATAVCAVILFLLVVQCGGGLAGGFLSTLMVFGVNIWVYLGVSAVQEIPMLAFGLCSSYLALTSRARESSPLRLVVAGMLMGIALEIKLTAALNLMATIGALFAAWVYARVPGVRMFTCAGSYLGGLLLTVAFCTLTFGHGSFSQMIAGHFIFRQMLPGLLRADDFTLSGYLIKAPLGYVSRGHAGRGGIVDAKATRFLRMVLLDVLSYVGTIRFILPAVVGNVFSKSIHPFDSPCVYRRGQSSRVATRTHATYADIP